mgnify:CR=1 FL=1
MRVLTGVVARLCLAFVQVLLTWNLLLNAVGTALVLLLLEVCIGSWLAPTIVTRSVFLRRVDKGWNIASLVNGQITHIRLVRRALDAQQVVQLPRRQLRRAYSIALLRAVTMF